MLMAACGVMDPGSALSVLPLRGAGADDGPVPDSVRALYREDAARLALRRILVEMEPANQTVRIPEEDVALFYDALTRVYDARDLPARDSIVSIHTFPDPVMRQIMVAVDSSASWTSVWRRGEERTGNAEVDDVMETYGLRVRAYHDWSFSHVAVLEAEEPLNLLALGRVLERMDGVRYTEPNGMAGDGPDIRAHVGDGFVRLDYSIGWGDCPSGCIYRRYWRFTVHADGRVEEAPTTGSR
jgi:hypothetical protein